MSEKWCNKHNDGQGAMLPLSDFPKGKAPFANCCKGCINEIHNKWAKANPDKIKANRANLPINYHKKWRKGHAESIKLTAQKQKVRRRGTTLKWYEAQLARQGGHCALCVFVPTDRTLDIDHDHACCPSDAKKTCGKCNRGLLCQSCNRGIGLLGDNIERLQAAISYLMQYGSSRKSCKAAA